MDDGCWQLSLTSERCRSGIHRQELLRGAESKEAAEVGDDVGHWAGKMGHFDLGLRTLCFPIDSTDWTINQPSGRQWISIVLFVQLFLRVGKCLLETEEWGRSWANGTMRMPRQAALKKAQESRDIAALKFALQQVGDWDGCDWKLLRFMLRCRWYVCWTYCWTRILNVTCFI